MKKIIGVIVAIFLMTGLFAACGQTSDEIFVISREAGSGTRGAFEELVELEEYDDSNSDLLAGSTNNVITEVVNNKNGIGYISLGSLNAEVKALKIGGVQATTANIIDGTYEISRPFLVVYNTDAQLSDIAEDFKTFLTSSQAQAVISDKGYVSTVANPATYTAPESISGTVSLNGSTSVGPLMEALAAEYIELNDLSDDSITVTQVGSSAGVAAAMEESCDFGMASRNLKDSETGLTEMVLCKDGIAVIVNKNNTIIDLTMANLKKIYLNEITNWSELAE